MSIVHHISNLLYKHDCVIVPGFGGFVSNYQFAKIHPVQHSFNPPSKRILFNSELKSNDGLLANHLMSEAKLSYQDAMREIDDTTSQWVIDLQEGKTIDLEKIGNLFADKEGNIQFEQDTTLNFLNESFGMTTFVSPAIRRSYKATRQQPRPAIAKPEKSNSARASLNFVRIAAAIAVLAMLGFVGFNIFNDPQHWVNESSIWSSFDSMFTNTKSGSIQTTDVGFENVAILGSETLMSVSEDKLMAKEIKRMPDAKLPERKMPTSIAEPEASSENLNFSREIPTQVLVQPKPEPEPQPARRMYHLIAGSFREADNAGTLIESFQNMGYQTAIIGPAANGFYRISIMACLRKEDALAELRKVRETINPNIWLLRH
jgi:hypothetical protein